MGLQHDELANEPFQPDGGGFNGGPNGASLPGPLQKVRASTWRREERGTALLFAHAKGMARSSTGGLATRAGLRPRARRTGRALRCDYAHASTPCVGAPRNAARRGNFDSQAGTQ